MNLPFKKLASVGSHSILLDGVRAFVTRIDNDGSSISISGWDMKHHNYKVGDYAVIHQKDGTSSQYKFKSIRSMIDPVDQYFADLVFEPRAICSLCGSSFLLKKVKKLNKCPNCKK